MCCSVVHTCSFASSGQCRCRTLEFLGDPSNSFCTSEVLTSRGTIKNKCEWPKEVNFKPIAIFNCSFSRNAKMSVSSKRQDLLVALFSFGECLVLVCRSLVCLVRVDAVTSLCGVCTAVTQNTFPIQIFFFIFFYGGLTWNLLNRSYIQSRRAKSLHAKASIKKHWMGKKIDFGFPSVKNLSQSPRFHVFGVHFDQNQRFFFVFFNIYFYHYIQRFSVFLDRRRDD